jgi:hypothetical protein
MSELAGHLDELSHEKQSGLTAPHAGPQIRRRNSQIEFGAPAPDTDARTKDSSESKRQTRIGNEEIDGASNHKRQVGKPRGASGTRKTEAC